MVFPGEFYHENDYNTPAVLTEEYYNFVKAPGKQLIIMEGAAHAPFMGDPERFNREVAKIKYAVSFTDTFGRD